MAIKRVVYWPRLKDEDKPDPTVVQEPNKNPYLGDPADPLVPEIRFYSHRDEATGNPDQPLPDDAEPTISISAGDKLYVEPNYFRRAVESYLLRVSNPDRPVDDGSKRRWSSASCCDSTSMRRPASSNPSCSSASSIRC